MRFVCSSCAYELEYSNRPPRFCSNCGTAIDEQATIALPPSSQPAPSPDCVGGYKLLRPIGSGGMGTVYEAEEQSTGRRVALKLIRPDLLDSPDAVERFRREGRLASTIIHPRCVFVLAADEEAGRPYIVMELMTGANLADVVNQRGPLPVGEAVRYIQDVIEGLLEAHHGGVIHRDVKPSNCFLDAQGRVKVGDFGLAKLLTGHEQLTRTGSFLGTFLYASPEQIRNDKVNHLTDVYSVCATLYYLLTGRAPFEDADPAAAVARTVSDPLVPMRKHRPEVPRTLDEVVLKGLARSRQQRWQSLEELRVALLPFVSASYSLGELAVRTTAYLLDMVLVMLPLAVLAQLVVPPLLGPHSVALERLVMFLVNLTLLLLYFGGTEAIWGCTLGKYLLRLRVRTFQSGDRPEPWRAVLRAACFFLILGSAGRVYAILLPLFQGSEQVTSDVGTLASRLVFGLLSLTVPPILLTGVGLALITSTMRRRNGYRGLHELLSGTCTIRLPVSRPRFTLPEREEWPTHTAPPDGVPGRLGAFRVVGVARQGSDEMVLYGADTGLERPVWLWLRRSSGPLSVRRRETARPGRPRWLGGGEQDGWHWDAFVATPGCLLADLVSRRRRLRWHDTLLLLDQLTTELGASEEEGTLPPYLSPEQVWVQASGQVMLLDAAVREPQRMATPLALLGEVAAHALEGEARPPGQEARPIHAPVPGHADAVLGRLVGGGEPFGSLGELYEALHAAHDHPDELSWIGRAWQSALCGVVLLPGLLTMFLIGPAVLGLSLLHCVGGQVQAEAVLEIEGREEMRERLASLKWQRQAVEGSFNGLLRRSVVALTDEMQSQASKQVRQEDVPHDDPVLTDSDDLTEGPAPMAQELLSGWWISAGAMLAWPVMWALVAMALRGGLSYWLVGIRLLDAEGRPAARWRCGWRALLAWLPIAGLLWLAVMVDLWRIASADSSPGLVSWLAWVSLLAWWLALLLLPAYAWIAVRWPNRGPHDRLAGTYPVPA